MCKKPAYNCAGPPSLIQPSIATYYLSEFGIYNDEHYNTVDYSIHYWKYGTIYIYIVIASDNLSKLFKISEL